MLRGPCRDGPRPPESGSLIHAAAHSERGTVQAQSYDAIVVGSGIAGGWAAKELTEKGLRVLLLERGKNVEHIKDYVNATKAPWQYPHRGGRTRAMELARSEEHTSELQSLAYLVCRLLLEKKKTQEILLAAIPKGYTRS